MNFIKDQLVSSLFIGTLSITFITIKRVISLFFLIFSFLMFEFLVKLIEHSEEDDRDGYPLPLIDIMVEDKNTDDDS